jgi:hypothetical protein
MVQTEKLAADGEQRTGPLVKQGSKSAVLPLLTKNPVLWWSSLSLSLSLCTERELAGSGWQHAAYRWCECALRTEGSASPAFSLCCSQLRNEDDAATKPSVAHG